MHANLVLSFPVVHEKNKKSFPQGGLKSRLSDIEALLDNIWVLFTALYTWMWEALESVVKACDLAGLVLMHSDITPYLGRHDRCLLEGPGGPNRMSKQVPSLQFPRYVLRTDLKSRQNQVTLEPSASSSACPPDGHLGTE